MPAAIDARGVGGERFAVERHGAVRGRHGAGDDAGKRALPVAGNARDADDLARVRRERGRRQPGAAVRIGHRHVVEHQQRRARRARRAAALRHRVPDHQRREARAVGARGRAVRHLAPGAQHRDAVGDRQHLVQLVRDEDDREPVRREPAQHAEQAVHLLRGEHGGRLVEHQDARAAIEHLEQLEPLLLADREARHAPVRRHVEAAVGHQREQSFARRPETQ